MLITLAVASALFAVPACSSDEPPAQNNNMATATATATTGGGISCDVDAAMVSCQGIICHGAPGMTPAITYGAGLDLFGADRVSKLLNQPAKYTAVSNPDACPTTPELLINSQNPAASLMTTKLLGTQACGEVMPFGLTIVEADKQCILEWVNYVASDPNAASAAAATSTTSTSATSTTSTSTTSTTSTVGTTGSGGATSTNTVGTTGSTDDMAVGGTTSVGTTGMGGATGVGGSSTADSTASANGAGGTMAAGGTSGI